MKIDGPGNFYATLSGKANGISKPIKWGKVHLDDGQELSTIAYSKHDDSPWQWDLVTYS